MGFRARKSFKIAKGVNLNVSKGSVGLSAGTKGARYSVHSSGRKTKTVGIPGTGISHVSTSSNKNSKSTTSMTDAQKRQLQERIRKKIVKIEEKRNKPLNKLKELYAEDKVTKKEYNKLEKRTDEISQDLVVFGRNAGVKLGERYVTGKITKEEFEKLKDEIIGDPETERDTIEKEFTEKEEQVLEFVKSLKEHDSSYSKCDKPKKITNPLLVKIDGKKVCVRCSNSYRKLIKYKGFDGEYYTTKPEYMKIKEENSLFLEINPVHILNYR